MTTVLYILGVVFFIGAIVVSIGLHEVGHLVPAKLFGGKVTQYFVGFGPTLWSKRIGETEYGVKAIPLGGFVKIVGMLPPGEHSHDEDDVEPGPDGKPMVRVRKSNTGMFTQLISDARAAEYELVGPEDADRLFYRMPWWKKVIVMAAGPTVNLAIAFVIFAALFATIGNSGDPTIKPVVQEVAACVIPASEATRACTAADPVTPAVEAGLKPGDRFVAFNGVPVTDWRVLQKQIRDNASGEATIVVDRDGRQLTLHTNTTVTARPINEDNLKELTQVGFLGVVPEAEPTKGGPLYTLGQMGDMTVSVGKALVTLPAKTFGVAKAVVGLEERDPESPMSVVGGGRIAGEVASAETISVQNKLTTLLFLVAAFNFFIGMFNFVPLLPLDGGHIAGALYEAARRKLAVLFGRPDPGHFDTAKLLPVAYVVGLAMLVMGVVLILGDLVAPISLTG